MRGDRGPDGSDFWRGGGGVSGAAVPEVSVVVLQGDCRAILPNLSAESVQCVVTSPPYWGLRDYGGNADQIGLERTSAEYVESLVEVFREVRRVLKPDGVLWLNLGDCWNAYNGGAGPSSSISAGTQTRERPRLESGFGLRDKSLKPKDLIGIPWRVALALQADGWWLRSDIIWSKPNPMPESVSDRPTKSHEYLFLLTKSDRYFYDAESIREPFQTNERENYPARAKVTGRGNQSAAAARGNDRDKSGGYPPAGAGRNKRSVWSVPVKAYKGAHFATYPADLIKPCILAGSRPGDMVLDPFGGSGTTGEVAVELGRSATLIELNEEYVAMIKARTNVTPGLPLG